MFGLGIQKLLCLSSLLSLLLLLHWKTLLPLESMVKFLLALMTVGSIWQFFCLWHIIQILFLFYTIVSALMNNPSQGRHLQRKLSCFWVIKLVSNQPPNFRMVWVFFLSWIIWWHEIIFWNVGEGKSSFLCICSYGPLYALKNFSFIATFSGPNHTVWPICVNHSIIIVPHSSFKG